jgi:guanylate kinase
MSLNLKTSREVGCIVLKPTNNERIATWLSLNHADEEEEIVSPVLTRRNGIKSNVSSQLPYLNSDLNHSSSEIFWPIG